VSLGDRAIISDAHLARAEHLALAVLDGHPSPNADGPNT
jgi:hypothetical protein